MFWCSADFIISASSTLAHIIPYDPTLIAQSISAVTLAGFTAYRIFSYIKKSKKAKAQEYKDHDMNTPITIENKSICKTTIYNASCGVLGNIIYDTGREMAP